MQTHFNLTALWSIINEHIPPYCNLFLCYVQLQLPQAPCFGPQTHQYFFFSNSEKVKMCKYISKKKKKKSSWFHEWEKAPLVHQCASMGWECCSVLNLWSLHDFAFKLMNVTKSWFLISGRLCLWHAAIEEWFSVRTPWRRDAHESAAGWKLFPWRYLWLECMCVLQAGREKHMEKNTL